MVPMLVVVSLELQVFHETSWIYQNSQDCLENSPNFKLIPKFPRSWENSQAVAALPVSVSAQLAMQTSRLSVTAHAYCRNRPIERPSTSTARWMDGWTDLLSPDCRTNTAVILHRLRFHGRLVVPASYTAVVRRSKR